MVAAGVIVATLVPALRQRGADDEVTGNDFAGAADPAVSAIDAWRAAELAMREGDRERGIRHYRMAVAFLPERADLRARFGFALALEGRSAQALAQLRLAVRGAPDLPEARLYYGAALLRSGRRRAGRAQFRRYLELDPRGGGAAVVRRTLRSLDR